MMRVLILILVSVAGWCSTAGAVEIKYWDRLPLAVPLTVGQERILMLDEDVRVGLPSAIASKLRVQSVGGTVYLRAAEALPPTRLQLQSVKSGDIILAVGGDSVRTQADFYKKVWGRGGAGTEIPLRLLQGIDIKEIPVVSIDRVEYFRPRTTY